MTWTLFWQIVILMAEAVVGVCLIIEEGKSK